MDSLILRIFQGEPKQQGMAEYSLCWRSPRHHAAQQASNAPALSTPSASQGAGASKTTPVSCPLPVDMENSLCLEDPSVLWALMGVTSAAGQDCSLLREHSSPFEVTDGPPCRKALEDDAYNCPLFQQRLTPHVLAG